MNLLEIQSLATQINEFGRMFKTGMILALGNNLFKIRMLDEIKE